jgi:hypothetical protein
MVQNLETSNLGEVFPQKKSQWIQRLSKPVQYVSFIVISVLAASLWFSPYTKTWALNSICIPSDAGARGIDSLCKYNRDISKNQFLEEMKHNRELLTAEEFANRITSYYDILVAVLGTMFLLFTIATYFSMKQAFEGKFESKVKEIDAKQRQIERQQEDIIKATFINMLRDSISFRNDLVDAVKGNIDGQFVTYEKIDDIENYIKGILEMQQDIMGQVAELQDKVFPDVRVDNSEEQ